MPKSRSKKPVRVGRPRILGPASLPKANEPQDLRPSLPPGATEPALTPSVEEVTPSWACPPDSKVRTTALQIIAMRIAGMDDTEIAKHLGLSYKSISPYVYRATKNGWLDFDNPKEQLKYAVVPKAVRNLDAALDKQEERLANGMSVGDHVALKVVEMTIAKEYDQQAATQMTQSVVAIKIEMPPGVPQLIREDTTGGLPAYLDAE